MTHIVVGTAGHIDHGKSALVMALTGTDPDRLKEEKARGITIDLGFAHWDAPGLSVGFVDVPGHERFVKNMLAGVGGIDAVLLVVAADESVMPQTREHFDICRLLHVPAGIIALTKVDLVDADMLELARLEVRELVQGSFLAQAPIVPVSSRTGEGLDALRGALQALCRTVPGRPGRGPVRLPIDRVFSMKGFGTVVTGTLVSGLLRLDDLLHVLPGERPVKVRGLQVHGRRQDGAPAGQRVAVNLGGVDVPDLARGDTLVSVGSFAVTRVLDARIDVLTSAPPVRHGARVRFHQGTSEVIGRISISALVPTPGEATAAGGESEVPPGRAAYARLRLESPLVLTRADRFILRAYSPSHTIAGGLVLDPLPPRSGIRTPRGRARFEDLDPALGSRDASTADEHAVGATVDEAAASGLPVAALASRFGLGTEDARQIADRLEQRRRATRVGESLVATGAVQALTGAVLETLARFHQSHPLLEGMPREEVRERLFARAAPGLFERVLDDLVTGQRVVARDRLALSTHRVEVAGDEARARDGLERLYLEAGFAPPDVNEAAASLGVKRDVAEKMLALLVRQRVLVRIEALLFHHASLARLKQDVTALKADPPPATVTLDVAAFKERYGISRKYAIPLLEFLDRERVTRRVGDSRVVI